MNNVTIRSVPNYLIGAENFESRTVHKWRVCFPFITAGKNVHGDRMPFSFHLDSNIESKFNFWRILEISKVFKILAVFIFKSYRFQRFYV